ncbi:MAG: glycosyltransferase family 2 protein [Cyanobacteria bacterium J06631_2]
MNQLVSIIIPVYNRADLLRRAIASILAQSYPHWEIIIVDDASQEDIAQVVKQIDDRLRYVRHASNLGGSEARNTGIREARGEFVAFLDSDDVWLPHKLQSQLEAIKPAAIKTNLVCYSQFRSSPQVFYAQSVFPQRGKQLQEAVADYLWTAGGEMLTSTLLLSRNLAHETLFKPGLVKHQDLDFVLRLEQQGAQFIFVPQILATWHNEARSDRISRNRDYQLSLNWLDIWREKLSERAIQGFMLKEIVPKMLLNDHDKPEAVKMLLAGGCDRLIPLPRFLFLMTRHTVPRKFQLWLKAKFLTHLKKAKL